MSRAFEVTYRSGVLSKVINADTVQFKGPWVVFRSEDGYLVVAYPADIVHGVMEVDPTAGR